MAPETLREQRFSEASDVYAYGVVMYEVYSFGAVPFGELKDEEAALSSNEDKRTNLRAYAVRARAAIWLLCGFCACHAWPVT